MQALTSYIATPAQLAAYSEAGDRTAYVRAYYAALRAQGFVARHAYFWATTFWRSNMRGTWG